MNDSSSTSLEAERVLPSASQAEERVSLPPKISIVTPSFNQGHLIEETIQSILLQDYPNLEYIVMDGGSTDATTEVLKKYESHFTCWVSEKDRGQSHAINKGIARCNGDIFNWINSDDLLTPGALWRVAKAWMAAPGRIVSGHTEFFDETGTVETIRAEGQTLRNFVRFWEAKDWGWAQPGTFLPLADLKAINGIREDLKYCLDYHMMVQLLARNVEVTCIDQVLARFRLHGSSKTVGSKEAFRLERVPTLRKMEGLPVKVTDREWDTQQARRLVDVGISAARNGRKGHGLRLLGRALRLSPLGATAEVARRFGARLKGRSS